MGGKTNTALTTIRNYLEEKGFPTDLAVKKGRTRPDGIEYTASGISGDKVVKLAKVLYTPGQTGAVLLTEDLRHNIQTPVCGAHCQPLEQKRVAAIPAVIDYVQNELKDEVIAATSHFDRSKRSFKTFLKMIVLDRCKMQHLVYCAWADTNREANTIRDTMNTTDQNHTCILIWTEKTSPAQAAGAIISHIKRWQRYNWPKPK